MSTLLEIEAAAEALSAEQKEELVRFLTARLRPIVPAAHGARLGEGPNGTLLLEAPPMTTENVKRMLEDSRECLAARRERAARLRLEKPRSYLCGCNLSEGREEVGEQRPEVRLRSRRA